MNGFKSGRSTILIATDVAARGIDVKGVDAVFNYDLPQDVIDKTIAKYLEAYELLTGKKL